MLRPVRYRPEPEGAELFRRVISVRTEEVRDRVELREMAPPSVAARFS